MIEELSSKATLMARIMGVGYWKTESTVEWADETGQAQAILKAALRRLDDERLLAVLQERFVNEATLQVAAEALGVRTRERVRQLEARAIRKLRKFIYDWDYDQAALESIRVVFIPGGPLDPAWISIKEAHRITGLARAHLRYLVREGKVRGRLNPWKKNELLILRESLREYVESPGEKGRKRKGAWNE